MSTGNFDDTVSTISEKEIIIEQDPESCVGGEAVLCDILQQNRSAGL